MRARLLRTPAQATNLLLATRIAWAGRTLATLLGSQPRKSAVQARTTRGSFSLRVLVSAAAGVPVEEGLESGGKW